MAISWRHTMKLIKLSVLALATSLVFSPINEVQAKEKTSKVAVQKKLARSTKQVVKFRVKSTKQAKKPATNETKKLYGVKGAKLEHTKVSTSQKIYREKGKSHKIIGTNASRQYGQVGLASYYGGMFNGRKTANGEIFNENKFTAAHKTLALGSYALVTNLRNGRKIVVRINDRGPFSGTRILDLSKGAAREIGMIQSGVAKVKIEAMQVDRQGYIVGKGAESLYQIAKRNGLPLKIKGEGKSFGFRADPTATTTKVTESEKPNQAKKTKTNVKAKKQGVVSSQKVAIGSKQKKTVKSNVKPKTKSTVNKKTNKKVIRKK